MARPMGRSALETVSWVMPNLALGGRLDAEAIRALVLERGVRRIVDCRLEDRNDADLVRELGAELLHLPTEDHCALTPEALVRGAAWIGESLDRGEGVYVHCEHGIGRSALLLCAALVFRGLAPGAALALAKRARARVSPSPAQLHALLAFAASCCAAGGRPAPAETWNDLAAIAYEGIAAESSGEGR